MKKRVPPCPNCSIHPELLPWTLWWKERKSLPCMVEPLLWVLVTAVLLPLTDLEFGTQGWCCQNPKENMLHWLVVRQGAVGKQILWTVGKIWQRTRPNACTISKGNNLKKYSFLLLGVSIKGEFRQELRCLKQK
jgi:hypothetical protein